MKKRLLSSAFILTAALAVYFSGEFDFLKIILKISPLLVGVAAGLMFLVCLRFNKSRISFMLALALIWFFKGRFPGLADVPAAEFAAFVALNMAYLAGSDERGIFSIHGLKKVIIITGQLALLYWVTVHDPSLYLESTHPVARAVRQAVHLPYAALPFFLLFIATVRHLVRDRGYDIAFALGAIIGLFVMTAAGTPLSEMNMLAVSALLFVGALSSIYTISYMDELTGLPGRRAFNEYTATLGTKYALGLGDIDHFKKFNDTYGHDTGDQVLKLVAKTLSTVRGGGRAFRFGGEEFVIVFNGKTREGAAEHLEQLRRKIAETPFTVRNSKSRKKYTKTGVKTKAAVSRKIKITMSFGAGDSSNDRHPEKVLKQADVALYKSKKRGRNRVTV